MENGQIKGLIAKKENHFDVIVAGGGPAGIGAALACARTGARTLLLESKSFFGGVASLTLWMPVNRLFIDGSPRGGIHDLFVKKIKQYGPHASVAGKTNDSDADGLDIQPEYLRMAVFELLEEHGCYYRLYSPVVGAIMDGNKVCGVKVSGKNGVEAFYADVVVDATGDGDVAYFAGAEMVSGNERDNTFMPASLVFAVANVDVERLLRFAPNNSKNFFDIFKEAAKEGYCVSDWYGLDKTTIPGVISVNNGGVSNIGVIDGTKAEDLTYAERLGLKLAIDFVAIGRAKKIPGLENAYLMRTGAGVAVRESRRIVGEYVQTVEDAKKGAEFTDIIARKYGIIDTGILHEEVHSGYAYPYRCLIPKTIDGLLVAGRCGSATHLGHAAGKSMGNMMEIGQAAGLAAAHCAADGALPRQANVKKLQEGLTQMGVHL